MKGWIMNTNNSIFDAIYVASDRDLSQTKIILEAIIGVENHDDKLDFVMALTTAKGFDPNAEWLARQEEQRKKNNRKKLSRAARDRVVSIWVLNNVKPGMMIKVSGTRDGKGWRKVLRWQPGVQEILECQKYTKIRITAGVNKWSKQPYITDHMPKKVVAVEINGEWKKIVDLIQEEKNE